MKKVDLKITNFSDIKRVLQANVPLLSIVALISFLTFINSVNGEFVSDDIPAILENPEVTNFTNALKSFQIQKILQGLIYAMFGPHPFPFHFFSLFLHISCVILFFIIIYDIFDTKTAAIASLLYSVHPLVSETVLWISADNYLINTIYLYISVIIFLIYKKTQSRKMLVTLFILFAFIALTFANFWVFIIPIFIAGIDFLLLENGKNLKNLFKLSPLFLISIFAFVLMSQSRVVERISSLNTPESSPYLNRLPYSIYMTLELLIYPKNLSLYHEGENLSNLKYKFMVVSSIILVVLTFYLWKKEKYRKIAALILLIFLSILPVFSPFQVAWFAADRYLYVGAGLFCVLLAMGIIRFDKKWPNNKLIVILTSILLVVYIGRSFIRTFDWKTQKNLWLATEKVAPYSPRVHNNLGDVYGKEQNWKLCIYHFQMAIQLNPNYAEAMHNLANTYMILGQLDPAKALLQRSVQISPGIYQSWHKLGLIAYKQGNVDEAKAYFIKALEVQPGYSPSIQALQILQQKNQ